MEVPRQRRQRGCGGDCSVKGVLGSRSVLRGGRVIAGLVAVTMVWLVPAAVAHAAGDPSVDDLIVRYDKQGWVAAPASDLDSTVALERRLLSGVAGPSAMVGERAWANKKSRQVLSILLVAFAKPLGDAVRNGRSSVIGFCASSVGNPPTNLKFVGRIKGASEGECKGTSGRGRSSLWQLCHGFGGM